ncbi:MAG: efflux transporter outer membrane subunit [Pseudomonadota bacterium]
MPRPEPRNIMAHAVAVLLLGGCAAAGPNYERPETVLPETFANAPSSGAEAMFGSAPPSALWASLNDPVLDDLLKSAEAGSTDIAAALATLDESRALAGLTTFSLFPTVTAETSADRNRLSDRDPFAFPGLGVIDVYRLGFDSTWEIDLFGSLRRQAERIFRVVEADTATLADMRRSVLGDVAQAYFSLRGAQAELAVQRENLGNQNETVRILERSLRAGRGTALDVARARALALSVEATLPNTEAAIARTVQRLAVLTATPAAELIDTLAEGALPALPERIEIGQPQSWLARRPDVRAAERQLAAATSGVGVEAAEFYPKIQLNGSLGFNGRNTGAFLDESARRWSIGPVISWRFLDVGRVRRNVMAAEARQRQALAAFDGVVLRALEDIESALATFRAADLSARAIRAALSESETAVRLSRLRFENGASSYLEVLDAERTRLDLANQRAQAETARATALAVVYKALAVD